MPRQILASVAGPIVSIFASDRPGPQVCPDDLAGTDSVVAITIAEFTRRGRRCAGGPPTSPGRTGVAKPPWQRARMGRACPHGTGERGQVLPGQDRAPRTEADRVVGPPVGDRVAHQEGEPHRPCASRCSPRGASCLMGTGSAFCAASTRISASQGCAPSAIRTRCIGRIGPTPLRSGSVTCGKVRRLLELGGPVGIMCPRRGHRQGCREGPGLTRSVVRGSERRARVQWAGRGDDVPALASTRRGAM